MYKTLVLNSDEWIVPLRSKGCGCNRWKYDELVDIRNCRKKSEERLSEMFNAVARKGFRLIDHRIRRHDVYDEDRVIMHGYHGVYLFEEDKDADEEYYFYFGPIIEEPRLGCKTKLLGCKSSIGCNGVGCKSGGTGCRLPWKGCGCGTNDTDEQFINFVDNRNNNETVRSLNKYFGLRTAPWSLDDSYVWTTVCERVESDSEFVKENAKAVQTQFEEDVKAIEARGFHFLRMIDLPAGNDSYTSAMLFTRSSHGNVRMPLTPVADEVSARTIHLSDFDLWYFGTVYGFLGWISVKILARIPIIGFIFGGGKGEKGTRTSIIRRKAELEAQYDRDFNSQDLSGEDGKSRIAAILRGNYSQELHFTTLEAYQREHGAFLTFLGRLFNGIRYKRIAREKIPFISENTDNRI